LNEEAFKYDDGVKFLGYGGTNAEPFCIEYCNFMHCYIFKLFSFVLCPQLRIFEPSGSKLLQHLK
jgi:hypothetical protein